MIAYVVQLFFEALAYTFLPSAIGILIAWGLLYGLLRQLRPRARGLFLLTGASGWIGLAFVHLFIVGLQPDWTGDQGLPIVAQIVIALAIAVSPAVLMNPLKDPDAVRVERHDDQYLARSPGGEVLGPMPYHDFNRLCRDGRITGKWAVRHQDEKNWRPVASIAELNDGVPRDREDR